MTSFRLYFLISLVVSSAIGEPGVPRYLKTKYNFPDSAGPPSAGSVKTFTKTKTKTKTANSIPIPPAPNAGSEFKGGCNSLPPTPINAGLRCSQYSGCRADCLPNYQFPNGATQFFITCNNGKWQIEGGLWEKMPACEPICLPQCQNFGICIAPNQCQCAENFSGPQCQFENKPCLNYPPLAHNSRRSCSSKKCQITCFPGYQFPDGSEITTMSCKNGFWVPDKEKWVSVPHCYATCTPPCLNGGNCLAPNLCQCPQKYRGPQCQYHVDVCSAKKLLFNGGYNCTGDQKGLTCSIYCAEGMDFEFNPALSYSCLYSEGIFLPKPIPQCTFRNPDRKLIYNPVDNGNNFSNFDLNVPKIIGLPESTEAPDGRNWFTKQELPNNIIPVVTINPPFIHIMEKMPKPGICFTWQGTHYRTFDGQIFSFDSKCPHTLVKDAVDNTFSVVVQNSPQCYTNGLDCSRIIKIYFDNKEYILENSPDGVPTFHSGKKTLPIPALLPGLRVEMSAHFIIVSLDTVGSKIKWDGMQLVQVEVQESLWNRTEGLCGNIDSDPSNDMVNRMGHKTQTISNLAISWKVEDLENECNDLPFEKHTCQESLKSDEAITFCKKLLYDDRFASCRAIIDASELLDACKWDYCSCAKKDPSTCACETMNVYVKTCIYQGIKNLVAWRDEKTCPMECDGGRIYKACGPAAGQPVCGATTEQNDEDKEGCVEGCYCPEGTVWHENQCITKDKCPCRLRGKNFAPGAQVPKECNTCTCNNGKWICTQVSCGARCAAIGDPHYTTFDGKKFDFMGQCSYYLVKTPKFSIEAENVACTGAISQAMNLPVSVSSGLPSCTKAVTVKIEGQTIKLKQNHDVVVNGQDISKIPYQIGNITIRSVSSIFLKVDLPNGMQVWWDGMTRVYIDIPANFEDKTKGLCGTFNDNQKDDFLTPENDIEQAVIPFANKWKTSETCNDVPNIIKLHPCSSNMHNQPTAEKHCQIIKSDLFSECHWTVDPEPYYHDCLYDMCSCEGKLSKCLCPTIAAYAEECSRQGVKIDWRDDKTECGLHCPSGQKYQICGNSCTRTCFDISLRPDCKPQCVEGCNCPEGEALNEEGECVPIGECKCQFDGLGFHPGYKEVRPGSKGQELCTCINAMWSCHLATEQEIKEFPKIDDFKALCSASANMEFTTCEPAEPITCRNMHNLNYFTASICHPGCKCKDDYVLDSTSNKCVKPSECPCHHGGKSYKENEIVQNDCNTCRCQNGEWTCTDRPCSAECSAWGDSHFKTFDDKYYDFQGQCDYILTKGSLGSDSFDVSIQNVPCGSLGTSCSKSVTIRVRSGDDQDSITLTKDKSLPDFESMKHITVRQKALFVIVEAPDLGIIIQWDRGTRVYVKVDPRWKGKMKGLCGNYNDNEADDFQTPSGGIAEASAQIFGDSWKLQSYCPETVEIIDTCQNKPERKVWALHQCGILKSSVFTPCHSEVPVDHYLEKCIFDTCACDQGGDCECLCTALAAYAQECNNRGVPIKWRSQKLCPMQCDERCSSYSPCISSCPTETCDNLLINSKLTKLCKEDTCIEGCHPKPCPPNQIYLNSSFLECVPKNICKPVCLEIDGTTYYEGDVMESDGCHSCFCSRQQKICKGQPCATFSVFPTTAPTTTQQEETVQCKSGWSSWINQNKPKFKNSPTHIEPLPTLLHLNNLKGAKCDRDKMINIECRTVGTHLSPKQTGLDVECSLEKGLICKSHTKKKLCEDFEIRVLCQCEEQLTTPGGVCDPVKPHKEHPTDCSKFYHCENTINGLSYVEKTCGPSMYYNPVTMVCDWPYAVAEIKPECKEIRTTTVPPSPTVFPEIEPPVEPEGRKDLLQEKPYCPPGETRKNCAIHCDRLCIYYSFILKEKDMCTSPESCEPGCVKLGQNTTCPDEMYLADKNKCVGIQDCLCRSNDGKPVKPGTQYRESDCKVCQCLNNYYSCDESACHTTAKPQIPPIMVKPPKPIEKQPSIFSTVTPPEECDEDHFLDLIQGDQPLPDDAFNASSTLSPKFAPKFARFSNKNEKSPSNWAPEYSNAYQYLEIDLGHQEPIYGVKVKGSPTFDEYVTSYTVSYSPDGKNFLDVLNKERLPQMFRGSIDAKTPVRQIFDTPFEAQIVRINPQTWYNNIALQVELIGCGEPLTTTVAYELITISHPVSPKCEDSMGLNDGTMSDQQVSVSSSLDGDHSKNKLKLSSDNAWQPLTNSPTEFIEFDFLEPRNISGIETKGGPNGWVTAFTVKYSHDNQNWNPVIDKATQKEKTFLGNFDSNTPQTNNFDIPINARYVKLIPTKWQDNIQMKVEIHGCFKPYPLVEELTTQTPSPCNECPEINTEPLELQACRCKENKWWDGENCVNRTECPCIVGHISYAVGTVYEKEDCSECICKLGGISYCNPKKCGPCESGLRSTVTSTCKCTCQPCPDDTILCPTSNICINSTLWCNGVQNCPDDEVGCTTTAKPTEITAYIPTTSTVEKIVEKCLEIQCPPGYKKVEKKVTKGPGFYLSPMFVNSAHKRPKPSYQLGVKTSGIKGFKAYKKPKLQRPITPAVNKTTEEKVCKEYKCESTKPPPKITTTLNDCPPVSCPQDFIPVLEESQANKECPRYACNPPPPPDAVCNVTGRTFNTFDETEYKYDICNHILARDLEDDKWQVALKKNCTTSCTRNLIIHHEDNVFVLYPDLRVEYNGFQYTVEQTKKIGSQTQSFSISRLGNTLLFVSNRYGFWLNWDKQGNVKLGVAQKLIEKVDGLCGYYSENRNDDKRKPNGSLARTTVEFGDSWSESEPCETKTCPIHIQNEAWEICNKVKNQILQPCAKVLNIEAFISRCMETACECLEASNDNQTAKEKCRCDTLQSFVVDCLTAEPNTDLSDWRMLLDCPVTCEAPLVYHDCYQRKCEPTCESITDPNVCPKIPHLCFPGCYCPSGFLKKGDTCIKPSDCKDCECNVLPHLQYVTYDGNNFTINSNCVYVMSRDIILDGSDTHKFQVLITNAPCKNNEKKTCVGKVTILYQGRKIHILNDLFNNKLKFIVNGERIDDFADVSAWSQVRETSQKHLKILLSDIQVAISVYFPSLGVSVKAPSHKYGGKLQGLCGDCDGDELDDFTLPSGNLTNNSEEFALSWLYDKLPGGQSKEMCQPKPEESCPPLPKDADPCNVILDYRTFGQCQPILDPSLFLEWCQKDTCGNHPELACTSIEAYARDCANAGFCIQWRTNTCPPKTCPQDQIYNPCGTKCPETCDSIKEKEKSCSHIPVEGCFCPEGKVFLNNTCVTVKDCDVCDDEGHHPGEQWQKDKCTTCSCEGTTVKCETEHCPENDKICEEGFQVVTIPSKNDECCDKHACVPQPTAGPTCETPQPITCSSDQVTKLSTKPNGCQHFICECKPPEECEPIDKTSKDRVEAGYVINIDESGCCPQLKKECKPELCPDPKECPQFHTLKNETGTGKCCPLYTCEPPKDKCIYENQYTSAEKGGERPRTEQEKQKLLKDANETWKDGPCRNCKCSLTTIGNYQPTCSQTECSTLETMQDYLDFELEPEPVYDQCCPNIKRTACKQDGKIYQVGETWTKDGDYCTIYQCVNTTTGIQKETKVTDCVTNCEIGSKYTQPEPKQCCGSCKPYACVIEGKVYEVGQQWQSPDHCTNYTCANINGSLQVQSAVTTCPDLPKDYVDNFVYETITVEGQCCKTHKTTACKVNGEIRNVGETWPSPDGDKCKTITCMKNGNEEIIKQESKETCKTNCSLGWEYKESNVSCCGDCIQVACVVNDEIRQVGESWTSPDKCITYSCDTFGDQFTVMSSQESCPSLENCPPENIYVKGCCKHCNITSAPQKICAPEAMELNKTIGIIKIHRGVHGECTNKNPISSFTECIGICESSTFFDIKKGSHESQCSCCRASEFQSIEVEVECEDGYTWKKKVALPSGCSCDGCAAPKSFTKTKTKTKSSFIKS